MAVKVCTATGFCMTCEGTIKDVFKPANKAGGGKFLCCGNKCIRIDDISTLEQVKREMAPEGEDEDCRPELRGFEVDEAGSRSGDED